MMPQSLTAKLAFYLRAYPDIVVSYDGAILNPNALIQNVVDPIPDPPPEYAVDPTPPVVTFVEWKAHMTDRKLLICNEAGIALAEYGEDWHDPL